MTLRPVRLLPTFFKKIWGTTTLDPWYDARGSRIGEVWFTHDDAPTSAGCTLRELMERHQSDLLGSAARGPGGRFPILLKFLFTSDKLSVQVHPGDAYALAHENSPGKTEMWRILRAGPGASVALGFREPASSEAVRRACLSGEIESMLEWFPVAAGETYFIPAGTVHALGGDIALIEVQQNSDITYRLYDYGRPRDLHLDRSLDVARIERHPGRQACAACPYFSVDEPRLEKATVYEPDPGRFHLLGLIEGEGTLDEQPIRAGDVWLAPASGGPFLIAPKRPMRFLRTWVPAA